MTALEWFLWITIGTFYIACLLTVCVLTFQKGRTVLGIVGIIFPILWLVGAVLPAKPGSRYQIESESQPPALV